MNITVIHGQNHKGVTYTMTRELVGYLSPSHNEIREFFLPKDGPDFCVGCNSCFFKGEDNCPSADKMKPVVDALEWADVIILDSPNYVMEMNGAMKNLLDHLAYRWVTHRPHGSMFTKVGATVCSSAGAPAGHTTRSMAKSLKWMGVPYVYRFPLISQAMGVDDLSQRKKAELNRKAIRLAKKVNYRISHPRTSIRAKLFFHIFRKMQLSKTASYNTTDTNWWVTQGWTKNIRPW